MAKDTEGVGPLKRLAGLDCRWYKIYWYIRFVDRATWMMSLTVCLAVASSTHPQAEEMIKRESKDFFEAFYFASDARSFKSSPSGRPTSGKLDTTRCSAVPTSE